MKEKQPSNRDLKNTLDTIVQSIVVFANDTQKRFEKIELTLTNVVTKDFLDQKLAALRGDLMKPKALRTWNHFRPCR